MTKLEKHILTYGQFNYCTKKFIDELKSTKNKLDYHSIEKYHKLRIRYINKKRMEDEHESVF